MMELVKKAEAYMLSSAYRVLAAESAALQMLAEAIPDDLEQAVHAILNGNGHVIVCGIGKSGHV